MGNVRPVEAVNENIVLRFPIVRRRDYFCISLTKLSELCEEELLIYDIVEEWEAIHGMTEEEVLQKVISKIEQNVD